MVQPACHVKKIDKPIQPLMKGAASAMTFCSPIYRGRKIKPENV
jgi:hypothetical protein